MELQQIQEVLEKKADNITAEETCVLDNWLTEASGHDCGNNPSDRHCAICFYANKAMKLLAKIEQLDDMREHDLEQVLLETEAEHAVSW